MKVATYAEKNALYLMFKVLYISIGCDSPLEKCTWSGSQCLLIAQKQCSLQKECRGPLLLNTEGNGLSPGEDAGNDPLRAVGQMLG